MSDQQFVSGQYSDQCTWSIYLKQCFPTCVPRHTSVPRERYKCAAAECRKSTGMLILVLILVLKDSLRTFFKSLSLSWSLGVRSLSLSLSLGVRVQEVLNCPCPGPWGSGPCPYPGPCGLVLVLVLVFSPYKDLFPLFHYSDLFA